MSTPILFRALLLVWLTSGCGGSSIKLDDAPVPPDSGPPPDTLAMSIFSMSQDTVLAPLVARWPRPEEPVREVSDPLDLPEDGATVIYRVQLLTTKDLAKAMTVRDAASSDFGDDVRIDFETPYYKVRVGRYATPQEAEVLLKEARRLGYRGAWAVRLRVDDTAD